MATNPTPSSTPAPACAPAYWVLASTTSGGGSTGAMRTHHHPSPDSTHDEPAPACQDYRHDTTPWSARNPTAVARMHTRLCHNCSTALSLDDTAEARLRRAYDGTHGHPSADAIIQLDHVDAGSSLSHLTIHDVYHAVTTHDVLLDVQHELRLGRTATRRLLSELGLEDRFHLQSPARGQGDVAAVANEKLDAALPEFADSDGGGADA